MSVGTDTISKFMDMKLAYDSLSQAIKLANTNMLEEKKVMPLIAEKAKLKEKYVKENEALVKKMPLASNLIDLGDGWYGIRYVNEKADTQLKTELLLGTELWCIERDGRNESELTRAQLEALLPSIIDEGALEEYKVVLHNRACTIVHERCGLFIAPVGAEASVTRMTAVSHHAGVRWVQRKMGITNDLRAEEYKRANLREIEGAVLEGFFSAEHLWTDDDGVEYYFDPDNTMYVLVNHTIVTLYESDFTFAKHINRDIVFAQASVIKECYDAWGQAEHKHAEVVGAIGGQLDAIDGEIGELEVRMQLLNSRRQTLVSQREESQHDTSYHRTKYFNECNKLFKKHDIKMP
jgi:hypothetical protein